MALKRMSAWIYGPGDFAAGCLLIWLRHRYFGLESLGNYAVAASIAIQFAGYRKLLGQAQPEGLLDGLELASWGWFLLALALPGEGPALGAAGFLVAQLILKAPLMWLVAASGLRHRFLIVFTFLALVGCLPFSTFSAYFQTFIPLMSVGDAVTTMSQKLFSGAGLWAAIVMLSVVYQSCALGYFYWSRVMLPEEESKPPLLGGSPAWMLSAGLVASILLGLARGFYGLWLRTGLSLIGVEIN